MIRYDYDPTLVDLTSNFFVQCKNVKVYLKKLFLVGGAYHEYSCQKERLNSISSTSALVRNKHLV